MKAHVQQDSLACVVVGAFLFVFAMPIPSRGQDIANHQKALAEITATADKICQSAPLEQTSEGLSLSGDAQAKLGGVVGKIADLGIAGAVKYDNSRTYGVLQKDLVQAIQIGTNCKLEVFRVLEKDLIGASQRPPAPNLSNVRIP